MNPLLIRLILTIVLAALGIGAYLLINKKILTRANRTQLGLERRRADTPAILYFTTPQCVPCKTTQRPALTRLLNQTGGLVQLIEVDAAAQPKLAESWGVLSVPTTFIIGSDGQARQINHGVASTEKLLGQLEQVEGRVLRQTTLIKMQHQQSGAPGTD